MSSVNYAYFYKNSIRREFSFGQPIFAYAYSQRQFELNIDILKQSQDNYNMDKLSTIERERNMSLPDIYRRFFDKCTYSIPANLVGTDLWNNTTFDLQEGAAELLEEDGIDNFLDIDDFVFMIHQGYMFWYFKANGDADPVVYGYYEGKYKPDNLGHFSEFVKKYMEQ